MKTHKFYLVFLLLLFISNSYGQCPKAEMYLKKAERASEEGEKAARSGATLGYSEHNGNSLGAVDAYAILGTYEAYVCQCKNQDNGGNAEQLKKQINQYVSQYASMVSKYGSMPRVTSCKGGAGNDVGSGGNFNGGNASIELDRTKLQAKSIVDSYLQGDYEGGANVAGEMIAEGLFSANGKQLSGGLALAVTGALLDGARQKQIEREQKARFYSKVDEIRDKYKQAVDERRKFVNQPKLKSTLDEDGGSFEPLYIYYAYVSKNYDSFEENVQFPSTAEFTLEESPVQFSSVYAFYPLSNGQYPMIETIKKQLLDDYFGSKAQNYIPIFFEWENSIQAVQESLVNNINKAVEQSYFNRALPPVSSKVVFLNGEKTSGKDYWSGKTIKKETTTKKKTDYWGTDTKSSTKKKTQKKKTDYWN